jgi:hypothetical protein
MKPKLLFSLILSFLWLAGSALFAWEPGVVELEKAIKSRDFTGYFTEATKWLNNKALPVDAVKIAEAAQAGLFKDLKLAAALEQRELIARCGADKLGAFAKADAGNQTFLAWLMKSTQIMALFLEGGEPQEKDYLGALGVLRKIVDADPDARAGMHLRMAMGTALSLARTTRAFHCEETIDPVQRYLHYKTAQKNGELTPMFDQLRVWEYAKVMPCEGTNADIEWVRAALKAMRPELLREARYIAMVSEVQYTTSDWGPMPHTFATVLNGGGKCGPRAWFGRFINQAFGVPVWGVKQPGHAAVGFLGNEGWKVKLGRGWDHSTWDGMKGTQFLEIVKSRDFMEDFFVSEHLRWLSKAMTAKDQSEALKLAAAIVEKNPKGPKTSLKLTPPKYPDPQPEKPWTPVKGVQHLVAVDFTKGANAQRRESFDFGKQVYFQKNSDGFVEYQVNIPKDETYGITLGHGTANGNCRVRVYVGDRKIGWMPLKNTKGLWGQTNETDFALPKTDTLRFVFPSQRAVVVKWIELKAKGNTAPTKIDAEQESKPAVKESDPNNPNDKDDQ